MAKPKATDDEKLTAKQIAGVVGLKAAKGSSIGTTIDPNPVSSIGTGALVGAMLLVITVGAANDDGKTPPIY